MKLAYFAFYETFWTCLSELDETTQNRFLRYIVAYGLHGEKPEGLNGFELAFWKTIEFAIDGQKVRASINAENRKGKKENERKNISFLTDNENKESKENKISLHEEEEEYEKEYEKEKGEEEEYNAPSPLSEYSKKIYDIFHDSGLPCANNNELSFLQRDYKNGLNYLHSQPELSHLHSSDVIGACENYAAVVNHPDTYIKNKHSFDRFVKYKNFIDFLPDNFRLENFIKFEKKDTYQAKDTKPKVDHFAKLNPPSLCKECGNTLIQNKSDLICHCDNCGAWTEYNRDLKEWEWETKTYSIQELAGQCVKTI